MNEDFDWRPEEGEDGSRKAVGGLCGTKGSAEMKKSHDSKLGDDEKTVKWTVEPIWKDDIERQKRQ